MQDSDSPLEYTSSIIPEFKIYNRYQELERRERERKEMAWEQELQLAMQLSEPLGTENEKESQSIPTCRSCPKLDEKCIKSDAKFKKVKSHDCSFANRYRIPLKKTSNSLETDHTYRSRKNHDKNVDIQEKLQNLEFIDRTPSPIERIEET